MAAQAATQGRFLGGRPPYGYRLGDAGPHPAPAKAALGVRIHRLEPDPITAPVVVRIFEAYVSWKGLFAIADGLTRDAVPSPSAYDRARNSHRSGEGWSKSAVRAILTNPRYTGVAVWGRQRRDEVLVDVEDVAAGHRTRMRWNEEDAWIRSPELAHKPLIGPELFEAARARRAANGRTAIRKPRRTPRPYLLRGLVRMRALRAPDAGELETRAGLLPLLLLDRVRIAQAGAAPQDRLRPRGADRPAAR